MASARSTVSMARTTPAQKPRGEQSTIFRSGLADADKEDIGGSRGPNHPQPAGGERPIRVRTWGCFWALSRHFSRPIAPTAPQGVYRRRIPVITDDRRLRLQKEVGEAQRRFAMSNAPLMPKATAVWLVDNTALTFDQVADFTKMHPLEVRAIADGDAAQGIKGMDPISTGQLTRDEIERGESDPNYRLKLGESKVTLPPAAKKKGPRYTPVSRRHERPSAILWLVRNHPELKDAQIMRLVGTTKTTIASVRDRTHWNASTLTPMDPVTLGLCSQIELDFEVQRAAKEKPVPAAYGGATLLPASETTKKEPEFEPSEKQQDDLNVDAVFAKLKTIGGKKQDDEEE